MGAAASAADIPDTLDADQAKTLLGDDFDQQKFEEMADEEGKITKDDLLYAAAVAEAEKANATRDAATVDGEESPEPEAETQAEEVARLLKL